MDWRALYLIGLCGLLGCQNASQQLSLYAPFGPAVVPAPNLARENAAPYYTAVGGSQLGSTPAKPENSSAANSPGNDLSHCDPYRGILLPGNYTPTPVALKSSNVPPSEETSNSGTVARSRPSGEEPIRIVEANPKGLGSALDSTIAKATEGQRSSGAVQFQASPPSGVVRQGEAAPTVIRSTPVSELARLPKTTPAPATGNDNSSSNSSGAAPGLLSPLRLGTPPASTPASPLPVPGTPGVIPAQPAEPRRLSLWNDPRDGSRIEPASYSGAVFSTPATAGTGTWRQRSQ